MTHPIDTGKPSHRSGLVTAGLAAALLWLLASCGQRGPLYLPDEEAGSGEAQGQEQKQDEEKDGETTGT